MNACTHAHTRTHLVEAASPKIVRYDGKAVGRALQLVMKVVVQVFTRLLRAQNVQHLPATTNQRAFMRSERANQRVGPQTNQDSPKYQAE